MILPQSMAILELKGVKKMYKDKIKTQTEAASVDEVKLRKILIEKNLQTVHDVVHEYNKTAEVKINGKLARPIVEPFVAEKKLVKEKIEKGETVDVKSADIKAEFEKQGIVKVAEVK